MGGSGLGFPALKNTLDHTLMVGFRSDVPTFFVEGNSIPGVGSYGTVGIGFDPTNNNAPLSVKSDRDEFAAEFINLFTI